jgi:hypothetical protein
MVEAALAGAGVVSVASQRRAEVEGGAAVSLRRAVREAGRAARAAGYGGRAARARALVARVSVPPVERRRARAGLPATAAVADIRGHVRAAAAHAVRVITPARLPAVLRTVRRDAAPTRAVLVRTARVAAGAAVCPVAREVRDARGVSTTGRVGLTECAAIDARAVHALAVDAAFPVIARVMAAAAGEDVAAEIHTAAGGSVAPVAAVRLVRRAAARARAAASGNARPGSAGIVAGAAMAGAARRVHAHAAAARLVAGAADAATGPRRAHPGRPPCARVRPPCARLVRRTPGGDAGDRTRRRIVLTIAPDESAAARDEHDRRDRHRPPRGPDQSSHWGMVAEVTGGGNGTRWERPTPHAAMVVQAMDGPAPPRTARRRPRKV